MNKYALPDLLQYLESTQAALLASVNAATLNDYPADGGWSQGQDQQLLLSTCLLPKRDWLTRMLLVRALVQYKNAKPDDGPH